MPTKDSILSSWRSRRTSFWVGTLTALAVLIAGCGGGGSGSDPGVASLGSSPSAAKTSSPSSSPGGDIPMEGGQGSEPPLEAALAYADCLRAHGLHNYPDPEEKHGGLFINVPLPNSGSGLGLHSPQVLAADQACARQRGAVFGPPTAEHVEELQKEGDELAECMRAHGIKEWPDPVINSKGEETTPPPNSTFQLPGFPAAQKACIDEAPGPS